MGLHYKFEGCPDLSSTNIIFTRNENEAQIQCKNSDVKSKLTCDKSKWIGDTNLNCEYQDKSDNIGDEFGFQSIGWEFLSILIICVTFLIGSCIFVLILWCSNRRKGSTQDMIYDEPVRNTQFIYRDQNTLPHQKFNSYDPRTQKTYIDRSTYDTLQQRTN